MSQELTVTIADRWLAYLQEAVANRRFQSPDHAVENALRLLEASEDNHDRLARLLEQGERSGDAGTWNLQDFLTEARERDAGRQAA